MAIPAFRNEICVDWSIPSNRKKQEQALASARAGLGKEYPIVIGGKRVLLPQKFHSLNPSKPAEIVGIFQKGDGAVAQGRLTPTLPHLRSGRMSRSHGGRTSCLRGRS